MFSIKSAAQVSILAASLVCSQPSAAQSSVADGTLLGARPYTFPSYADAYGYTRFNGSQDAIDKYWTEDEYESAVADERFEFQKLQYASDGLTVIAYVYKPREASAALPTIVFNRGSGWHKDIAPVLVPYFHRLAQEGFVVIAPMYRQTDGGEGSDANGGDDVDDLMNILPVIVALPYADADNIFMTGESRGAMMVYQAIREDFPMRAAAVWGGFTDMQPLMDAQPAMVQYAQQNWPGFGANNMQESIEKRSAIYWPEAFDVPVLFMHGESDGAIPVGQTYNLVQKLQELDRLYGLIVFADDNHILSRSELERDRASVQWFRRFNSQSAAAFTEFLHTTATVRDLNDHAWSLYRRGRLEDAVDVLRIGVERFPESSNIHDSYGEALAMTGDKSGAIESYARALELSVGDSEHDRITGILATLRLETKRQ